MKKGQLVEGVVKKVKFPNKGIVNVSGEEKASLLKMSWQDRKYRPLSIKFAGDKRKEGS